MVKWKYQIIVSSLQPTLTLPQYLRHSLQYCRTPRAERRGLMTFLVPSGHSTCSPRPFSSFSPVLHWPLAIGGTKVYKWRWHRSCLHSHIRQTIEYPLSISHSAPAPASHWSELGGVSAMRSHRLLRAVISKLAVISKPHFRIIRRDDRSVVISKFAVSS